MLLQITQLEVVLFSVSYIPHLMSVCQARSTTDVQVPAKSRVPGHRCSRPSDEVHSQHLCFSAAHLTEAPQQRGSLTHSSTVTVMMSVLAADVVNNIPFHP